MFRRSKKNVLGVLPGSAPVCNAPVECFGLCAVHQPNKQNCSLCFKLQAYPHAHFGMQSMLVVYTVLPVCLGPIALLHHPIRCKRDTTGRGGGDGLGGKRWGSSLVPWLIPNEMQIHPLPVCWVPLFFFCLNCRPFPLQSWMCFYFQIFWFCCDIVIGNFRNPSDLKKAEQRNYFNSKTAD